MAWTIELTTKHGTDHFGEWSSKRAAKRVASEYEALAERLQREGVNCYVEVVRVTRPLPVRALVDVMTDMAADHLGTDNEKDSK